MNYTLLIYFREQHRQARLLAHVIINSYCVEQATLGEAAQAQVFHNLALLYTDRVRAEDRFELLILANGIPVQSESWFARRALTPQSAPLLAGADYLRLSDEHVEMVCEHRRAVQALSLTYICESQYQSRASRPRIAR